MNAKSAHPDAETAADLANAKAERVERRLSLAVILAAVASVPATFLTTLDGRARDLGHLINYLSLAVLTGESVILLLMAHDRRRWIRRHWFPVSVALMSIPAVILAVGPVQMVRLLRFVGALRILRVRRIFKAGQILRRRAGLTDLRSRLITVALSLLAAAFVAIVLSDPTTYSRQFLEGGLERFGLPAILLAGTILAGATFLVVRYRGKAESDEADEGPGSGQ